jgi:UDP-N-acetylglucosamine diphosphorylase/glucosamine-1-phosphate N-acetyltransferase
MDKDLIVVIMAAGKGTRMNNPESAKVMYSINDRPMIEYVVDVALQLDSSKTIVIVGWQKDAVIQHLSRSRKQIIFVDQSPQLGTGHAVMQVKEELDGFTGDVLVLSGDVPLLSYDAVRLLVDHHRLEGAAATVLTAELEDASGYGRIIRSNGGDVLGIVEDKDATSEQQEIGEINTGIYVFNATQLFQGLMYIKPSNMQKEYYLTDVFQYFQGTGLTVCAVATRNPVEVLGVNTPKQLEEVRGIMSRSR